MGPGISWKGNINGFYKYVFGGDRFHIHGFAGKGMGYFLPWFMDVAGVNVSFRKPTFSDNGFASIRVETDSYLLSHFAFSQKSNSIVKVDSTMRTVFEAELKKRGKGLSELISVETYFRIPEEGDGKYSLISPDKLGECLRSIYTHFDLEHNKFYDASSSKECPPKAIKQEIICGEMVTITPVTTIGTEKEDSKPILYLDNIGNLVMAQMALLANLFSYGEEGANINKLEQMLKEKSKTIEWGASRLKAVNSDKVIITAGDKELTLPMPQAYITEKEGVNVNYIESLGL